jgi:DNA-binding IclR family transcriptional regulator
MSAWSVVARRWWPFGRAPDRSASVIRGVRIRKLCAILFFMRKVYPSGGLSSVSNALQVVELLGDGVELRVVDVAAALQVSNATAHRILSSLKEHGFVRQPPGSTRYLPGPAVLRLARRVSFDRVLRLITTPRMQALCRDLKETINLEILVGGEVLFLASAEDHHRLRVALRAGTRSPAHACAGGKVLLSSLADDEVRQRVGDQPEAVTDRTLADVDRLLADLRQIRHRGYGISVGEIDLGVHAVAVPVTDAGGGTLAALSLAAPEVRLPTVRIPMVVPHLQNAASLIAADCVASGLTG